MIYQSTDLARDCCALSFDRARNARAEFARALQHLPHTTIDAVIEHEGKRELVPMRWGLVPSWKKTAKETPSTFNARAETVATKPMFRSAFKRSRCLIPASGYYEWLATATGKQPSSKSSTIIITNANDLAAKIHDRMPVLLQPKDFALLLRLSRRADAQPDRCRLAADLG